MKALTIFAHAVFALCVFFVAFVYTSMLLTAVN